jgi:hypothetical protein
MSAEQVFEQLAESSGAASGAGSTVALIAREAFDKRPSRSTASSRCDDATVVGDKLVAGVRRVIAGSHGAGRCRATRSTCSYALAEDLRSQDHAHDKLASLGRSSCAQVHRHARSSERTRATRVHTHHASKI